MTYNTCLTHKAGSLVSSFVYLKKRDGKRASHSECMLYILVLRFALAHKGKMCCRNVLLEYLGEALSAAITNNGCCDICCSDF